MVKHSLFAIIFASSITLVGCGHSEGQASESKANTDSMSSSGAGAFPLPKEFAHRYNTFAIDNLKVVEVKDIGGVGAEDWTELDLADKNFESIDGQVRQKSFNYNPRYASEDVIRNVCAWMVRAASPNISEVDAMAMATSVTDRRVKMIVGNTILDVYATKYDKGCEVSFTGL